MYHCEDESKAGMCRQQLPVEAKEPRRSNCIIAHSPLEFKCRHSRVAAVCTLEARTDSICADAVKVTNPVTVDTPAMLHSRTDLLQLWIPCYLSS